jgi:hypothetical protein
MAFKTFFAHKLALLETAYGVDSNGERLISWEDVTGTELTNYGDVYFSSHLASGGTIKALEELRCDPSGGISRYKLMVTVNLKTMKHFLTQLHAPYPKLHANAWSWMVKSDWWGHRRNLLLFRMEMCTLTLVWDPANDEVSMGLV